MRLITLNVALFETNNNKLSNFLSKQNADIVCLQEVTKRNDSSVESSFISKDIIDKATKTLKHSSFKPYWIIKDFRMENFHQKEVFHVDFKGFLELGYYIKSKYKILKALNVFVQGKLTKITVWTNFFGKDPRSVQVIDLELPNAKKLRVLNYHGIWTKRKIGNKKTLSACKKINALAKQMEYPTIIVGDFNLFPDTESMKVFKDDFMSLVDKYNISTTRPKSNELSNLKRNVVDYIFVSNQIKVNSFEVLNTDISDHLPLSLDFDL